MGDGICERFPEPFGPVVSIVSTSEGFEMNGHPVTQEEVVTWQLSSGDCVLEHHGYAEVWL